MKFRKVMADPITKMRHCQKGVRDTQKENRKNRFQKNKRYMGQAPAPKQISVKLFNSFQLETQARDLVFRDASN